jgi:hypothetical protein
MHHFIDVAWWRPMAATIADPSHVFEDSSDLR